MLTYAKRAAYSLNPTGQKLFSIMEEKKTNLALSIDLVSQKESLELADRLGDKICMLKTHVDIFYDFTPDFPFLIQELAERHRFVIFEDRKFADIGNTVKLQYAEGIYRISDWADITNAHIVPGKGIIEGLRQVGLPKGRGLVLLAEMSAKGSLAKGSYTKTAVKWADEAADFVIGFICRRKLSENPGFIHMTPGVNLASEGDLLGQTYLTPEIVIGDNLSDVMIVGRGIYEANHPEEEAEKYRQAGWEAYLSRF